MTRMKAQPDALLTYNQIAELIGLAPATLRKYRERGYLPPPDWLPTPDRPHWRISTIQAWLASRPGRGAPGRPRPRARREDGGR